MRQTAGHGIRDNRRHEAGGGHPASDHGDGDGASPDAGEVLLRPLLQGQVPRERERPGILRPQHHGARLVPQHLSEWKFYDSKSRYALEQESSEAKGEFLQLYDGGSSVPIGVV